MRIAELMIGAVQLQHGHSSTPHIAAASTGKLDVTASNYWLAVILLLGAVAVICVALAFAFSYHAKLLEVIKLALRASAASAGTAVSVIRTANDPVTTLAPTNSTPAPAIDGPAHGAPSAKLEYVINGLDRATTVSWVAESGDPAAGDGQTFATRFDTEGSFKVTATYPDGTKGSKTLSQDVKVAAPVAAGRSNSPIILPFVIKNWGRLVIVIFGVGVISALMSTKILDAAAGIGILGTLLGVGAVTATSGTSGEKPTSSADE